MGEMNPPGALYRRRSWAGVTSPKFRGKMPAIEFSSHCRTWGTRRRMEHLIRHYGLRSARNDYRACEVTFSRRKNKDACGANNSRSKPHFSPRIRGKNQNFEGLLWDTEI